MRRHVWSQLRHRPGRTSALLAGVLVATTGFTVLTGAAVTARLTVTGTLSDAAVTYDLLVRPPGGRSTVESAGGLVRPNALSGQYGGITTTQYRAIQQIAGDGVAAPIGMVGYSMVQVSAQVDVTGAVDRSLDRQLIRMDRTFTADSGLSRVTGQPAFVFVTRNPVEPPDRMPSGPEQAIHYPDGYTLSQADATRLCPNGSVAFVAPQIELLPGGGHTPLCTGIPALAQQSAAARQPDSQVGFFLAVQLLPDGRFRYPGDPAARDRLVASQTVTLPFQVAAIDPVAENRLVGLDRAVTAGRALTSTDAPRPGGPVPMSRSTSTDYPVLFTSSPQVDAELDVSLSSMPAGGLTAGGDAAVQQLQAAGPRRPAGTAAVHVDDAYREELAAQLAGMTGFDFLTTIYRAGQPVYQQLPDGSLRPEPVSLEPDLYLNAPEVSWQANDTAYRPVTEAGSASGRTTVNRLVPVGMFDPARLAGGSPLMPVPMDAYQAPVATGADRSTQDLLHGGVLRPDGNPGGYLASPPLVLMSLDELGALLAGYSGHGGALSRLAAAPISAVRVKVAGVHGYTKAGTHKVQLVAEQIATATGLDVDIVYGSSVGPQTVTLSPGAFGRPGLRLSELWSRKGVAAVIVRAVDRKSLVLFLLVLVVCGLFLGNAVSASVRDRRPELAILSCLGWPARRIAAAVLAEVGLVGLVAGTASAALAVPLGHLAGVRVSLAHALVAVPVALAVVLAGGAYPALRAAGTHPAAALRPPGLRGRRASRPFRTVLGLALVNLRRVPGRAAVGAAALGLGIAGLTVLLTLDWVFQGAVVGTVLGDTIVVRARAADNAAVVATILLGAAVVADVLYVNVRERAGEVAVLHATGWSGWAQARLLGYEAVGIGLLGGLVGGGAGLLGVAALTGHTRRAAVGVAALGTACGVLLAVGAAVVPALLLRRTPAARQLAEE